MAGTKRILNVLLCLFLCAPLFAAGGVGPDFLRISPPAKAASFSGAYCAVPQDINSLLFNPAGIADLKLMEITLSHFASFADTNYEYGALVIPLQNGAATSIGVFIDYTFDFVEIDEFGDECGNVENYDAMGLISYAQPVFPGIYLGGTLKFFYSKLYVYDKIGFAFDAGGIIKIGSNPDTYGGISVQNIGWQQAYIKIADTMPINIKAGVSTSYDISQEVNIGASVDVNRLWIKDELPTLDLGAECTMFKILCARAGYGFRHDAANLSIGIGVLLEKVKFAYAYQPFDTLGATHRISLDMLLE
ncbi:MAG TPA: PorV/PorQ family protein [Candidatus Goldiibacteriota bacterium]|nr:PorV/PorQ family protein [Candidatus Goldiibacteriota bacterium]HPN65299.1 PorV/PorQ family protein [Candidatus Goldiibacteriota bacterium]HRQ42810.1 PorV/PorQ family protein [Candidatus Goldiibacteriota bacterium]